MRDCRHLNTHIRRGELCCVVGKIGIGKSSLLLGTMGELLTKPARPGARHGYTVEGSVAYVSQTAWIPNATVRDVILFGKPFREDWYWKVVEACALASDLELLPAGDRTEIGERGVVSHRSSLVGVLSSHNKTLLAQNLSGGQKQRVALARAAYADTDVVILGGCV